MNDLKYILPGEPIPRGSLFHERRYRVAMRYTSQLQRGGTLLDIGCGNGSQTEFFARHVRLAYGLDLQVTRLPGFKRQIEQNCGNLTIMGGNGEQVPFKDKSFDYVTCFEVIEHVVDQQRALQEIYRVLKPGGEAILSVPHRWWVFETHGADLPLLPWNRFPFFSWLPKVLHDRWARARIYRQREIQKLMDDAGFKDITTVLLTAPMDVLKIKSLQKLLRATVFKGDTAKIPLLSSTIFVHVKKNS